jgi:hypothetical protein
MYLVSNIGYPATQYEPAAPETNGVYHEDREVNITGAVGASLMYRTFNAMFDPGLKVWAPFDSSLPAYAYVQNSDGSIHYYTLDGSGNWLGTDNNTVYNAVDFGTPALSASGSASDNTAALGSLFAAIPGVSPSTYGGGFIKIPQYNYPVNASSGSTPLIVPDQTIFQGLGTGGQDRGNYFFHFSISDGDGGGPYTFFTCSNPGNHTPGGTIFRNIAFQWSAPGDPGDTCLDFNLWNNIAQECTFTDCPVAIKFLHLQQSAKQCSINYGNNDENPVQNPTTAIIMAGVNCEISGPSEFNGGKHLSAGTRTCILMGGGLARSNMNRLRNLHIFYWDYGIDYYDFNGTGYGNGTQDNYIDGCHVDINKTAIHLKPSALTKQIFNQNFTNNVLTKYHDSTDGSPIVFIDSNGGLAENIGPISFVNNLIYSNVVGDTGVAQLNQYGVEIGTCSEVSIIGGQISQCGTVTHTGADGTANICISGNPSLVILDSVNLNSTYLGANNGGGTGGTGSGPSQYALLVTGDPNYVQVNNCNMYGFSGPGQLPVSVTGSPTTLIITNTLGYNDQNTVISTLAHIFPGTAYSAATMGAHGGTSYYGPSFIMFTSGISLGGTVAVNGVAQPLLPSQLVCLTLTSPYDTIEFNMGHGPTAFTWIGK